MGVLSERGAFTRLLYALEAMSCRRADRVCVVTPRIGDDLLSTRRLIRAEQLLYIPNGAELALFGPGEADEALRAALGWSGRFVALYTGAHGLANGLDQLIDAAERLRDWGRADILIVALGDGPRREALREETTRRGLGAWVQWLDAVPRAEVPRYLRSADAGLVVLRGVATFQTVYPNKLFDALASGRAVVCNVEGAASALVEEAGAGRCVEAERPDAIACALCELADDRDATRQMGHDGYAYVSSRFSREELAHRYLEALAALVERR
jgi:glycosyltransferase involved in cell wall biosynthesis